MARTVNWTAPLDARPNVTVTQGDALRARMVIGEMTAATIVQGITVLHAPRTKECVYFVKSESMESFVRRTAVPASHFQMDPLLVKKTRGIV